MSDIAPAVDRGLHQIVRSNFEKQGFTCRSNLSLQEYDASLPDIDLLVISEEATLGFVLYVCELKAPIPPSWSKDQLRVLNKDSVAKAFRQLDKIAEFLGTEAGVKFIRSQLPKEWLAHYGQSFVIAIHSMIVTSNNAGMFFGDKNHKIIDYRTLGQILDKCDGDVTYVDWALGALPKLCDERLKLEAAEARVGGLLVQYEGVTVKKLIGFGEHKYKSVGLDKKLAEDFIAEGGRPLDVLRDLSAGEGDSEGVPSKQERKPPDSP